MQYQMDITNVSLTALFPGIAPVVAEEEEASLFSRHPEYLAMIGMGCLIILLVITAVVSIFILSGRDR